MGFQRLLIATDGSPTAERALLVGLNIAAAQQSHVTILHVTDAARGFLLDHPDKEPAQDELERLDPVLASAARAARAQGVRFELAIADEHGATSIAAVIAGFAEGLGAEMIVVGTRGHGEFVSSVLGSVSHALLRTAAVPVVVVNAEASASAP